MSDKLNLVVEKVEVTAKTHKLDDSWTTDKNGNLHRKAPKGWQSKEKKPEDYYSTHLVEYGKPDCTGYLSIDVLPFLKGKPWDSVALAYVHSLRPSSIRVTTGLIKLDARSWRVTIYVEEDNITIRNIEQEVEVGLPAPLSSGAHLQMALMYGLNSPEAKWYEEDLNNPIVGFVGGLMGEQKQLQDGTYVPFPRPLADTQMKNGLTQW